MIGAITISRNGARRPLQFRLVSLFSSHILSINMGGKSLALNTSLKICERLSTGTQAKVSDFGKENRWDKALRLSCLLTFP